MQEFFWKYASFDPYYLQQSSPKTRKFFFLTGLVLFVLTICSFVSYAYVGYVLYKSIIESIVIGAIFSYLLFNFYRVSLLTFSWQNHKKERIVKSKILSISIKLFFMTLNIFFFLCAFEMFLYRDMLSDYISNSHATDGIFTRLEFLFNKIPSIPPITFCLSIVFTWPLFLRFFSKSFGNDYDLVKANHEAEIIKNQFDSFLIDYRKTIHEISGGKANEIVYDCMIDPPFDVRIGPKKYTTVEDGELFRFLENNS